jgi:hypothetical protein
MKIPDFYVNDNISICWPDFFIINALSVSLRVPWPLTIGLSEKVLDKYRILFCFILRFNWVERSLRHAWLHLKTQHNQKINANCQYMIYVFNVLNQYVVEQNLEPSINSLEVLVQNASSMEKLTRKHLELLDSMLMRLFLCKSRIIIFHALEDLLISALNFAKTILNEAIINIGMIKYDFQNFLNRFLALVVVESLHNPQLSILIKRIGNE